MKLGESGRIKTITNKTSDQDIPILGSGMTVLTKDSIDPNPKRKLFSN